MRHQHAAAVVLALAAALTACTSGGSSSDAKPKATAKATTAKPSPTPSMASPLAIGQPNKWHMDGGYNGSTTVLAYTQPIHLYDDPGTSLGYPKGSFWATVEVKVCNNAGSTLITVSQTPWTLGFKDGTRTETTGEYGGDFPKPEFPALDTNVTAGECLRGKIPFPVAKGQRPDRIIYSAESRDPVIWTVPAK